MRNRTTLATLALIGALVTCPVVSGCGGGANGPGADSAARAAGTDDGAPGEASGATIEPAEASGGEVCSADADCVPAQCCHPTTCTHKDNAPDCRDIMCTMDCRAGTMDCGGGRCVCIDGRCEAEIFPPEKTGILPEVPSPPPAP